MRFFDWLKRNKMPRLKAKTRELFKVVGFEESDEWQTIKACFANCEEPPTEVIFAAYRVFISCKDAYGNELLQEAFTIREEIVLSTVTMISGEEDDE